MDGAQLPLTPLLTSQEVGALLKMHPKVVERMAKRGEIPACKIGKFWRYRRTSLDAWIDNKLRLSSVDKCVGGELACDPSPMPHGNFALKEEPCQHAIDSEV